MNIIVFYDDSLKASVYQGKVTNDTSFYHLDDTNEYNLAFSLVRTIFCIISFTDTSEHNQDFYAISSYSITRNELNLMYKTYGTVNLKFNYSTNTVKIPSTTVPNSNGYLFTNNIFALIRPS